MSAPLADLAALTGRELRRYARDRAYWVGQVVFPLAFIAFIGYGLNDVIALPSGDTLADLLPTNMKNPFDSAGVPVVDGAPTVDGEVGYDSTGLVGIGYTISGMGKNAAIVITLTNGS